MKKNSEESFFQKIVSSPIFILISIVIVFYLLFYFFGPKTAAYDENEDWKNSENVKGSENAVITITEYGDYQCPACGNVYDMVENVLQYYGDKVKLVYKHYPLPFHQFATRASVAAECAGEQGKFWEMHRKLYKSQSNLGISDLKKYAQEIELDADKFSVCLQGNGYLEKINKHKKEGDEREILGTPSFFIEGKELKNSENENFLPRPEDFKREIDLKLTEKSGPEVGSKIVE